MTKEQIFKIVEDEDVEFIRLQFTDIFGVLKNQAITVSQLERALDGRCMFDGSCIEGFIQVEESDMYLRPDLDTFEIFPWRPQQGKVARLFCDVYTPDGEHFIGDPRNILKRTIERAHKMGYQVKVGPECEFYLYHTDENGLPTTYTHDHAGYFDVGPLDLAQNVRRDIDLSLEDMGYDIESSHHEISPAQHDIDFKASDPLYTADEIQTFRMAVKVIAKKHGLHATFMPKPKENHNGSGMHINFMLTDEKGKNVFADDKDECGLSKTAYSFMAGLLSHMKEMTLITNPIVNSYKRLVPGFDAPLYLAWSKKSKRSTLIRVPSKKGEDTTIELRSPDSTCNPYFAIAVCIAAGLDGIEKNMDKIEPIDSIIDSVKCDGIDKNNIDRIPPTLGKAIEACENSTFVRDVLGDHTFEKYIALKKAEWDRYKAAVTSWELEEYLYRY